MKNQTISEMSFHFRTNISSCDTLRIILNHRDIRSISKELTSISPLQEENKILHSFAVVEFMAIIKKKQ